MGNLYFCEFLLSVLGYPWKLHGVPWVLLLIKIVYIIDTHQNVSTTMHIHSQIPLLMYARVCLANLQ